MREKIGMVLLVAVTFVVLTFILFILVWLAIGTAVYGTGVHPDYWKADTPLLVLPVSALLALAIMLFVKRLIRRS